MICIISLTQVEERLVRVIVMVLALLLSGCVVMYDPCDPNNPTRYECGFLRKSLIERENPWLDPDVAKPSPTPGCAPVSDPACW